LEVRKIKSATSKLCFVTLLSGGSGQEDWRAKLLAQYSNKYAGDDEAFTSPSGEPLQLCKAILESQASLYNSTVPATRVKLAPST
jgi:hypothetical protein